MTDVVVIGGGYLGMLTARFLHEAGADVLVLEKGRPGREASWAGGGILSPLYPWRYPEEITRLAALSQRDYPAFSLALYEETGIDPQWTRNGLLIPDTAQARQALRWQDPQDNPVEILDAAAVKEIEPGIGATGPALWMPRVAQIRNPRLLKALRRSLEKRGVRIREQAPVQGIDTRGGRVTGVRTPAGPLPCARVVLATGAWAGVMSGDLEPALTVKPVRGQMILFRAEPGVVRTILLRGGHYVIPRRDGRVLAGSTLEDAGFEKVTTRAACEELHEAALDLIPALGRYPVEHHWAGLRPGTPGGIPYIGEHPQIRGFYLNCGHHRNGVVLGLASARVLSETLSGGTPALSLAPFSVTVPRPGRYI